MNGIDGQPIHWGTCDWDKWASLHYCCSKIHRQTGLKPEVPASSQLIRVMGPLKNSLLPTAASLISDRNLLFCFLPVWALFNWKQTLDYLVFKDFPGLAFRCRKQITRSIQPLGALPWSLVTLEKKVKYYDHTLTEIYLFILLWAVLWPGWAGRDDSKRFAFQFLYLILFPDFYVLTRQQHQQYGCWWPTVHVTVVCLVSRRWAPSLLSSVCWLQQSVWKAFLDDKSAQRSIYCHIGFTDCLQHGRHIPPPTAVFTVLSTLAWFCLTWQD